MRMGDVFESKYLKSGNIPEATFVSVIIDRVELANLAQEGHPEEKKPVLFFRGKQKGMVLNKGNWQILEEAYGDSDDWGGHTCSLYITATNTPDGKPCMGLRVAISKAKPAPRAAAAVPKPAPAPVVPAQEYSGEEDSAIPADDIPF